MKSQPVLLNSDIPLPLFSRGKVRDTYHLGDHLLIVTTDRISAFDVVLPCGIPDKGRVLNMLSSFWFNRTKNIIDNHLIETVLDNRCLDNYLSPSERFDYPAYLEGRSMIVKRSKVIPVECVVRGYISGSAWADYRDSGTVNGEPLPEGLRESEELPEPIFTPTTKAESGHDQPLSAGEMEQMTGRKMAGTLKGISLEIYRYARRNADDIIIADTKIEFGMDSNRLILVDELLTPDSSRFWDTSLYKVGQSQPSYDKQPVRDWLAASGWNREPPAPDLPADVVEATSRRYRHAYQKLTGEELP
ncbi:MAG: phosphoribosylaminoimidazolesuccinocarboxamide synthase [Dehalococcoidales bacterium]